ncbi:MAG: hypothetical protein DSY80_01275 [Desulfocapsa sp.]|nr:MAG: hypothetical protein DSY80_01275 [Desulfocapsa sp.]
MLVTSWSIGLSVTSLLVLFIVLRSACTAVRVVKSWDPAADTPEQIRLESEIPLSSTLMAFALFLQIFSLLLLLLAADSFAPLLPGAMCATGSFLANAYGMPSLIVKLFSVFLYGFWILIHRLDLRSPRYPLVRVKNIYLLLLCPLLLLDILLQTLYLQGLHPDIITSCCGVIFTKPDVGIAGLSESMASYGTVAVFYSACLLLFLVAWNQKPIGKRVLVTGSVLLFPAGLWIVTTFISPYVYAMPHHRCPFCLLQIEYNFVGYPLFVLLYFASFAGMGSGLLSVFTKHIDLQKTITVQQRRLRILFTLALAGFVLLSLYFPLRYLLLGGE